MMEKMCPLWSKRFPNFLKWEFSHCSTLEEVEKIRSEMRAEHERSVLKMTQKIETCRGCMCSIKASYWTTHLGSYSNIEIKTTDDEPPVETEE